MRASFGSSRLIQIDEYLLKTLYKKYPEMDDLR